MTFREKLYHFLDVSTSKPATIFRISIIILILLSVAIAIAEFFYHDYVADYSALLAQIEYVLLIVFTIEFLLRWYATPSQKKFWTSGYTYIDLIAIVPFYFAIAHTGLLRFPRILRLLRLLRVLRVLKFIRLFKQGQFTEVFKYKNTILEQITPIVAMVTGVKIIILILESRGHWIEQHELGVLFTIIGFALGIILSQKIGRTYGRYQDIEKTASMLHGKISAMVMYLNSLKEGLGTIAIRNWLQSFMDIYHGQNENSVRNLLVANQELYNEALKVKDATQIPHHRIAALLKEIFESATYITTMKTVMTPTAYDRILNRTNMMYIILLAVFIPGITGLIAVLTASYLLYGLFYLARDFDYSIGGGAMLLIELRLQKLEHYLDDLNTTLA